MSESIEQKRAMRRWASFCLSRSVGLLECKCVSVREGKLEGEQKRARESKREQERVEVGTTGMLRTYANSEGMILKDGTEH